MNKQLTNHDIELNTWLKLTRDELKAVAKKNGIGIPSNKEDLAFNLQRGFSNSQHEVKTFKVRITV